MKRRYEVARLDALENGLGVTVIVHEAGPSWKICFAIPWHMMFDRDVARMVQSAADKQAAWEARQRERLDDSLF